MAVQNKNGTMRLQTLLLEVFYTQEEEKSFPAQWGWEKLLGDFPVHEVKILAASKVSEEGKRFRKQLLVLEISYTEEPPTEGSSHTLSPAQWNWRVIVNSNRGPYSVIFLAEVLCATETEPVQSV